MEFFAELNLLIKMGYLLNFHLTGCQPRIGIVFQLPEKLSLFLGIRNKNLIDELPIS